MVDRSIHTRKALVHSILIGEVKDMKNDVLQALKRSLSEKNSRKKNYIDFEFLPTKFSSFGLKKIKNC